MIELDIITLAIIAVVVIVAIFLLVFFINKNKFIVINTKIDIALLDIESLLEEKKKLLRSICKNVDEIVEKELFPGLEKLDVETDVFVLSDNLYDMEKELMREMNYRRAFVLDDDTANLVSSLENISIQCSASEEYYNDKIAEYKKISRGLVSHIAKHFFGGNHSKLFEHKDDEVFEILKDK